MNKTSQWYYELAERVWSLSQEGDNDYWRKHFMRLSKLMQDHQVYPYNS
jgi:hypothetical protein